MEREVRLNEVKLVENISKNPQIFLEICPVRKEVFLSQNCKTMHVSIRIILDYRKIALHREIAKINGVIQVFLT